MCVLDRSEFGCLNHQCRDILVLKRNFFYSFCQTNLVAHNLAREVHSQARPIISTLIPNCIAGLLSLVCFNLI